MPDKRTIVGVLGERELLLPELVHEALAANERAKYLFSLLQLACAHAERPGDSAPDLRAERELAGIADERLDGVVARSERRGNGAYLVPLADRVVSLALEDVARMIAPLQAPANEGFIRRLAALRPRCAPSSDGSLPVGALAAITSSDRERGDSLHLLVADVHKALNALEASLATELIEGARAYRLGEGDRPLVAAFMKGVNRTAPLKFSHPGLGTTATRSGPRLVLQNDLGQTEAHVLIVHVEGLRVVIVSTDVHVRRLGFLQSLLAGFKVTWKDTWSRRAPELEELGLFYQSVGTLEARDPDQLTRFLEHLGSRLVFLIDWNRARKILREFVPKASSLRVLQWAADEGFGHRGFLECGGARLVYELMAAVIRTPFRFGERLDEVLGEAQAERFLKAALQECSAGLLEHRSQALIRVKVRAELSAVFHSTGERLLGPVADHAAVVAEMGRALRERLRALDAAEARAGHQRAADTARAREHEADEVVTTMRGLAERTPRAAGFCQVVKAADDAADALEEAAFLLTLLPEPLPAANLLRDTLAGLGDLVVACCDSYLACARAAQRDPGPAIEGELIGLLESVDRVLTIEREMDETQRRAVARLLGEGSVDAKLFTVVSQLPRELEHAVDALTHAALLLRDRMTSEA